jgi:adhesin transport system outer membrane protein
MGLRAGLALLSLAIGQAAQAAPPPPRLAVPPPDENPMTIDFSTDPVLNFGHSQAPADLFRTAIAHAIETHAQVRRAAAAERQAAAVVQEAHAGRLPTVDLQFLHNRRLSAAFSDRLRNQLEQIRPNGRTDATLTVNENLFDFGATTLKIESAKARKDQAEANFEGTQDDLALDVIAAWYDVAAYRALIALAESMQQSENDIRSAVQERIRQGASAQGDLARVDVYMGRVALRLAQLRGQMASAEARFRETTGMPPPASLERPALALRLPRSIAEARLAANDAPEVRAIKAQERAAGADWRAVRAENLPSLDGQLSAGRYGVFENARDYDVRGQLVLSHRLFGGGGGARQTQAHEQFRGAQAATEQVIGEAERDAETAFVTLAAYEDQVRTLETAYAANRRTRDVLYTRFRNLSGTLFDVLVADDDFFETATSYLTAISQRDAQKLALLRKCGTLLEGLNIAASGPQR